jgi:hypothetical protein
MKRRTTPTRPTPPARPSSTSRQPPTTHALAPTLAELTAHPPREEARRVLARDVRAAVPDHAGRILADPVWPALATVLVDAEARGHQPHQLLKEAAAQRELTTARQPARVLITRIQHTGRNPAPNRRAAAARRRTTMNPPMAGVGPQVARTVTIPLPAKPTNRRQS